MGQKKIDLVSLALPRLTTQLCIQSFLRSWADRDRFHVRWIFHLDQYAGMEHNYLENLQMAAGLAGEFDESLLLTTKHNLGYGGSYARAFGLVEHDVLNVEDDFLWLRPNSWRLADVIRATGSRDGFSFQHQNVRFGGTTPAFWRRRIVNTLLAYFGDMGAVVDERNFKGLMHQLVGARHGRQGRVRKHLWRHLGQQAMVKMGYSKTFYGKPLPPPEQPRKSRRTGCRHLGRQIGVNVTPQGTHREYVCRKAAGGVTTVTDCADCNQRYSP